MPTKRPALTGPTSAEVGSERPNASVAGHGTPGSIAAEDCGAKADVDCCADMRPQLISNAAVIDQMCRCIFDIPVKGPRV